MFIFSQKLATAVQIHGSFLWKTGKGTDWELKAGISDGGTGLNTGIPKAFPDICIQPDVFHELHPVGAELSRLERKAEKLISQEAEPEKRAHETTPGKKTLEQLSQIRTKVEAAIHEYELLRILFCWLVELFGFSGYPFQDTYMLADWILSEMETAFPRRPKLHEQTKRIRGKIPQILSFNNAPFCHVFCSRHK